MGILIALLLLGLAVWFNQRMARVDAKNPPAPRPEGAPIPSWSPKDKRS